MAQSTRSLVLVTVDCLRRDHCGLYGYSKPTTPFLDSLAPESFVVPTAIVAGAPTYYSLPAILASRMPLALGRDVVGIGPGESTLATVLHESGYATGAFSAGNPYISPRFGYDQGFEVFHDFLDLEAQPNQETVSAETPPGDSVRGHLNRSIESFAGALGLSRLYNELYFQYCMKIAPPARAADALRRFPSADILVEQAQAWLASVGQRPFFLWLHLMDPHAPYYPPNEAFRHITGTDIDPAQARYLNEYWNRSDLTASRLSEKRDRVFQLYDAGIRWVDCQIARLVNVLRQKDVWDDCVFAVTADHGEEFLEHGGRYHAPVRLTEEIIRVPLLIRVPGERSRKMPTSPMSQLHLAPTLLEIIGVGASAEFQGRSLWPYLQPGISWPDPAIIECVFSCTNPFRADTRNGSRLLAVRNARFKLVIRFEPEASEEFYDLEVDPAEIHPNSDGIALETRKQLLEAACDHMQKMTSRRDVTSRLRARLRDLRLEWGSGNS